MNTWEVVEERERAYAYAQKRLRVALRVLNEAASALNRAGHSFAPERCNGHKVDAVAVQVLNMIEGKVHA